MSDTAMKTLVLMREGGRNFDQGDYSKSVSCLQQAIDFSQRLKKGCGIVRREPG